MEQRGLGKRLWTNPWSRLGKALCLTLSLALCLSAFGCATQGAGTAAGDQDWVPDPHAAVLKQILVGGRRAAPQDYFRIQVVRNGKALKVEPGLPLARGDEIYTTKEALAVLLFPDGALVFIQPEGHVRIESLFAYVGHLFVKVKGYFLVESEYAQAASEGTRYFVSVSDDERKSAVTVLDGRVRLVPSVGKTILVEAGKQCLVGPEGIIVVDTVSPEELKQLDEWARAVERAAVSGGSSAGWSPWAVLVGAAAAAVLTGILLHNVGKKKHKDTGGKEQPSDTEQKPPSNTPASGSAGGERTPNAPSVSPVPGYLLNTPPGGSIE